MFHKEGHKIIVITFIIIIGLFLVVDRFINVTWLQYLLFATLAIFLYLILQFFRNPKRNLFIDDHAVVSPVDGKVVVIEEVFEPEFFKEKFVRPTF